MSMVTHLFCPRPLIYVDTLLPYKVLFWLIFLFLSSTVYVCMIVIIIIALQEIMITDD